tara:strand:- start:2518 stop:2898 length:381 start_codon:yes stop_codon:yes gene_type:complete
MGVALPLTIENLPTKASPSPLSSPLFSVNDETVISQASPAVPKQKYPTTNTSPDGCRVIAFIPSSPELPKFIAPVQFPVVFIVAMNASLSPLIPTEFRPVSLNMIAVVKSPAITILPSLRTTWPAM